MSTLDDQVLANLQHEREWCKAKISTFQERLKALDADILAIADKRLRKELGLAPRHDGRYEVER